jgi:hypothetical protein
MPYAIEAENIIKNYGRIKALDSLIRLYASLLQGIISCCNGAQVALYPEIWRGYERSL